MAFWQEEDRSTRAQTIKSARNGGSVNPAFFSVLKSHQKSFKLDILTHTTLLAAEFSPLNQKGLLTLSDESELEEVDYVVCATGGSLDFSKLPFVKSLMSEYPTGQIAGCPNITHDLQWNDDVPAFVMGAYSMLEVGADAANLAGTRQGAERIVHRNSVLERQEGKGEERGWREDREDQVGGTGGYFGMLGEERE